MLAYPTIDPVLLSVGPIQLRWYGLMYVIGFAAAYLLVMYQAKLFHWQQMRDRLDDLHLFLILGVVLGGRLGYVLFYNPAYYLAHPLDIPAIWSGGMSFHGGCMGALLAGYLFCRRTELDFWKATDLFIVSAPIGLFFGRLGNFINGELFGRITVVPWGMVFPEGGPLPRHPSQLYEALLEGLVLFILLWTVKAKPWQSPSPSRWPHGTLLALFLGLYGCFRFLVEFVREPDPQIGLIGSIFSMGQLLCLAMIVAAPILWWWRCQRTTKGRAR
ncbi:MAG: prolipoprotein diacylglyceryl transferase [Desulfobulbus sp.]|jgi:phosphatidylglycerol:prolipoprotein diacylglycerol transferase|uniref:prolipoprotein diacylglyceryl transferase n=1 Tax=Desulfobulbus sp. TaxID=895 RepID=UPI0028431905|nr:prolipoprotein diacylglyceryl transferase [Desulfobulbus sp.]MDR2550617.1 prolipoprotein diacylglyceryl transferase [Desulfobulbus sp.]